MIAVVTWTNTKRNTFVSRKTGYFVFFAIALSLYQEGNTCLCWQVGFLYSVLYAEVL